MADIFCRFSLDVEKNLKSNYDEVYQTVKLPGAGGSTLSAADITFQIRQETDRMQSMLRNTYDRNCSSET